MNTEKKKFSFEYWKEDDWYIAKCWVEGDGPHYTQGKTEDELFDMVADLYKAVLDIRCSLYRRIIFKIFGV